MNMSIEDVEQALRAVKRRSRLLRRRTLIGVLAGLTAVISLVVVASSISSDNDTDPVVAAGPPSTANGSATTGTPPPDNSSAVEPQRKAPTLLSDLVGDSANEYLIVLADGSGALELRDPSSDELTEQLEVIQTVELSCIDPETGVDCGSTTGRLLLAPSAVSGSEQSVLRESATTRVRLVEPPSGPAQVVWESDQMTLSLEAPLLPEDQLSNWARWIDLEGSASQPTIVLDRHLSHLRPVAIQLVGPSLLVTAINSDCDPSADSFGPGKLGEAGPVYYTSCNGSTLLSGQGDRDAVDGITDWQVFRSSN